MGTREVPFSELLSAVVDNRGKTCPTAESGIPLIATNCIRNELLYPTYEKARFVSRETYSTWFRGHPEPGDILFVNKATPGRVCLVPDPVDFCIAQDMVAVRPDPGKVYPLYLLAALRSEVVQERIKTMHVGTLIPHFKKGDFDKLLIPVPDPAAQELVGDIYYRMSAKIELNRRMNETLEAMARALFKSWFVDFLPVRAKQRARTQTGDPVRAKAEGRLPAEASAQAGDTGLPPHIADLFPASFEDSELGEIPKGWDARSIYEIADVVYGAPFASSQFNTEGLGEPLIRIRDLANESPGVWTTESHPKGYRVQPGDILVGMDGEFRTYLWGGTEAWLNQRVCVFFPAGGCSGAFVRNSINQPLARVESTETATTVIHLGKSDIDRFSAVVPSPRVLAAFNRLCQPWYDRIVGAKRESRTLAALRDRLLPKLITGELRAKDADRISGRFL